MKLIFLIFAAIASCFPFSVFADPPTAVPPSVAMPPGKIQTSPPSIPAPRFGLSYETVSVLCGPGTGFVCDAAVGNIPAYHGTITNDRTGESSYLGSFRFSCGLSHVAFDDPLVWSGRPGMTHGHTFVGNTSTSAFSDTSNPRGSGNSTCDGGTINLTQYWFPGILIECSDQYTTCPVDANGKSRKGEYQFPSIAGWYYKMYGPRPTMNVVWPPTGLGFITGSATNTDPSKVPGRFECYRGGGSYGNWTHIPSTAEAQSVGGCEEINILIGFQVCWDGVNLKSPIGLGYSGNMAPQNSSIERFTNFEIFYAGCPPEYPVEIPQLTFNIHIPVKDIADLDHWRLTSDPPKAPGGPLAGLTMHADVNFAWDLEATNCGGYGNLSCPEMIRRSCFGLGQPKGAYDCHSNLLGMTPDGHGLALGRFDQ